MLQICDCESSVGKTRAYFFGNPYVHLVNSLIYKELLRFFLRQSPCVFLRVVVTRKNVDDVASTFSTFLWKTK